MMLNNERETYRIRDSSDCPIFVHPEEITGEDRESRAIECLLERERSLSPTAAQTQRTSHVVTRN